MNSPMVMSNTVGYGSEVEFSRQSKTLYHRLLQCGGMCQWEKKKTKDKQPTL